MGRIGELARKKMWEKNGGKMSTGYVKTGVSAEGWYHSWRTAFVLAREIKILS